MQHLSQRPCDQQIGVGQTVSLHSLDDQGAIARTKQEAVAAFGVITELYKEAGLPLSEDEKQGCGLEAGEWLGWWLDFRQQVLKVTPEKVASHRADLKRIMEEKRSTRDQLLQIAGRLSSSCQPLRAWSTCSGPWHARCRRPTPGHPGRRTRAAAIAQTPALLKHTRPHSTITWTPNAAPTPGRSNSLSETMSGTETKNGPTRRAGADAPS